MDYEKQAQNYLDKWGIDESLFKITYVDSRLFLNIDEKVTHPYYKVESPENKKFDFKVGFYLSLVPTFCVLICATNYNIGDIEKFSDTFGFDKDSRRTKILYKAAVNQIEKMKIFLKEKIII